MDKTKQFLIGMLLGFKKDHEIFKGLEWDRDTGRNLLTTNTLTKEDFFSKTLNDKSIFEYGEVWAHFGTIAEILGRNGEHIEAGDLRKVIANSKSPLDLALDHGAKALEAIFTPEVWAGRANEMEDLWFSIQKFKRPSSIKIDEIRDAIVRKGGGGKSRSEQLKSMELTVNEVREAIKQGEIVKMNETLEFKGDYLRPADALLSDDDGDHALYTKKAWENFETLAAIWERHNDLPGADFFLFHRGSRMKVIESAYQNDAQGKVLNARIFAGRPEEFMKLYRNLTEEQRRKIDGTAVLCEIVAQEHAAQLDIGESLSLSDLTMPLYVPDELREEDGKAPMIIGLGLKKTWEHMEEIRDILKRKGEAVTLDDLRLPFGLGGETCLMRAAEFGCFEHVMDIVRQGGGRIEVDDLLKKTEKGKSALDILAQSGQVNLLFDPELWKGRTADLAEIWKNLPEAMRNLRKEDFSAVHSRANQLALREFGSRVAVPVPGL